MSNPSFIISFSVCMAVCRSYSRSESGNSSYGTSPGCVFNSSLRVSPYFHPSFTLHAVHTSCTLRAMASVSSVKLSGKVIFSAFKGDGVYVFIFCYLKCGSKKFIGSNIRHFGRQKQKKGKLFPKKHADYNGKNIATCI